MNRIQKQICEEIKKLEKYDGELSQRIFTMSNECNDDEKGMLLDLKYELEFVKERIDELKRSLFSYEFNCTDPAQIAVGNAVVIKDLNNGTKDIRIVFPENSSPKEGLISKDCPLGKALLGRSVGDRVKIVIPFGHVEYEVLGIRG